MQINFNHIQLEEITLYSISDYTSGRSEGINKSLWKYKQNKTFSAIAHEKDVIKRLLTVFDNSYPLKNELIVFSGIKNIKMRKYYKSFTVNDYIHVPSLLSSSMHTHIAQGFTTKRNGVILNIILPKGYNKGIYLGEYSEHKYECEFLLAPNQTFQIKSIKKIHNTTHITIAPVHNFCTDSTSLKNVLDVIYHSTTLTQRLNIIKKAKSDEVLLKYSNDSNISVLRSIMLHKCFNEKVYASLLKNEEAKHYLHFIKQNKHFHSKLVMINN
jgi:hypothetical protein